MSDLDAVAEAGCVFCPANWPNLDIVHQRGRVAFINPLNPVTEGHVLAIHWDHDVDAAASVGAASRAAVLMRTACDYAHILGLSANIITSIGEPATQSVFHTHLHVVPRRPGDGLALPWTGQKQREAATVSTVEQLDALPDGTVIHPLRSTTVASIEKRHGVWWPSCATAPIPLTHLPNAVPALVLWRPEAVDR